MNTQHLKKSLDIRNENGILSKAKLPYAPQEGLGYEYFFAMKKNKNRIAQKLVDTRESETFGELLIKAIRTALRIKKMNLPKGSIICLNTHHHKTSWIPVIAAAFNGLILNFLDPTLSQLDTNHLVSLTKPKLFFASPETVQLIETALKSHNLEAEIVTFGNVDGYKNFNEFLLPIEGEDSFEPVRVNDLKETAIILFSSGTTGFPKGIALSHFSLLQQIINLIYNLPLDLLGLNMLNHQLERKHEDSPILFYSSFYWLSAILFSSMSIFTGCSRIVCSKFNPKMFWKINEEFKPALCFSAPIQAVEIAAEKPSNYKGSNPEVFIVGGTAISKGHMAILKESFRNTLVIQGYGQTEVAGVILIFSCLNPKELRFSDEKLASCGLLSYGVQAKVVNLETEKTCTFNQKGELRIKVDYVMNGYYGQDSSAFFDSEGWLKTGDVVYFDEDYCFYIVDRIKEMFKYKSWHVAPAILEAIIYEHPAIEKVVVVGVPHEIDGDLPTAVVKIKENKQVTSEEIIKFAEERVSETQRLRGGVIFVKEFPLTPSGKIKRVEVRDMVVSMNQLG